MAATPPKRITASPQASLGKIISFSCCFELPYPRHRLL
jgi:hypothetical protein